MSTDGQAGAASTRCDPERCDSDRVGSGRLAPRFGRPGPGDSAPPLPGWVRWPAGGAIALLLVPLIGLALRLPWSRLPELLTSPSAVAALRLSLLTCTLSTTLACAVGLPLALLIARAGGTIAAVGRLVVTLPMVLPPVVAGVALLVTLGRRGVLGRTLSAWGVEIGFTTAAVVLAQTFVAMPYLVAAVEAAARSGGTAYERTAAVLGASPNTTLWRVTLPLLRPAVVSGAALAFARSLGEFGATLTFAGSLAGVTRTLPLEISLQREADADAALALAFALMVTAVLIVGGAMWATHRSGEGPR